MKLGFIFFLLIMTVRLVKQTEYMSNFNASAIDDSFAGDAVSLPIILNNPGDGKSNVPLTETYNIDRYELKDTNYTVVNHDDLGDVQHDLLYKKQPPNEVFDIYRITIEDYQLLELKDFRIMLVNPSKFKFCINEIYADSDSIKRIQHKKLPFCLNPYNKYPFFFTLYITDHKPLIFRTSIYFIISIYDGQKLVDEKIWPREIIAKVSNNHLRLGPLQAKNCGKNLTTLAILNPQPYHIKISFENEQTNQDRVFMKQVMIPSQKSFRMTIPAKEGTMIITTWSSEMPDIRYPKLFMPIYCVKPLEIDFFNIGILNDDRSLVQVPIPVTNNAKDQIVLKSVEAISTLGTVEILPMNQIIDKVLPGSHHTVICRLLLHIPKQKTKKTSISIRISYSLSSNIKEILQTKSTLSYLQFRNPLSTGGRSYLDVTREPSAKVDPIMQSIFPIKNNLNLPLLLVRVIFDEKMFKLTWLKDRREYIYSNQNREEFSLQYIGPRTLKISPMKFLVMLEFNGNLFIPVEVAIFDHTLQCLAGDLPTKCINTPDIDYGYFRGNSTRFKQLVIRNWNPVGQELEIKVPENASFLYGMNCSINIFGPFPKYDVATRHQNQSLFYYLQGGHFIIITFALTPLENATSGQLPFSVKTPHQIIERTIKFKVQNGTIALIPQVLRISSAYEKSVEYLNLVSTFSQPYKIKSTTVNTSNIEVFFNNKTQIFENQWIGLALVYEPFSRLNMTQNCCGHQFALNHFINALFVVQFRRFSYVNVKVVTTTELQANSTIIIDNKPPKMIQEDNISVTLVESNKLKEHTLFNLKNIFSEPIKYSIIMVPEYLHEDAKQYITAVRRIRKNMEQGMFCVNNGIAVKHNFSPQMVKNLFDFDQIPQQVTIQPLENNEYYVGSQRKNSLDSGSELSPYVVDTVALGARICYRAVMSKYLKDLIQTKILNQIAEEYPTETFLQFIQKEMLYLSKPSHFYTYDQFYDQFSISPSIQSLKKICQKFTFPIFRFCHHINIIINPTLDNVLSVGQTMNVSFKFTGPQKQISELLEKRTGFYVTILNNVTKYESHHVQINLTQPKLAITDIFATENSQNVQSLIEHKQTLLTQSQYLKAIGVQKSRGSKEKVKLLPNILPVSFNREGQLNMTLLKSERMVQIRNLGEIDIKISHMGFQGVQNTCQFNGIQVESDFCKNGAIIKEGETKNISIKFNIDPNSLRGQKIGLDTFNWFLYCGQEFYFRIVIVVKTLIEDNTTRQRSYRNSVKCLLLNLASLVLLVSIIISMKKESQEKQKNMDSQSTKKKLLGQQNYYLLGNKIDKKYRRTIEPIPEDMFVSVKAIQDKKFKEYFNSSDQSQITSRNNMAEEDQPSGNQILNALKQDRNNVSVSEESSIDFIDLNTINRSTDNVGEYERAGMEEQSGQGSDPDSDPGSAGSGESFWQTGGDEVSNVNLQDYGWGTEDENNKKENKQSDSYYNVFFTQNPLKKQKQNNDPFSWMQDFSRGG